jgi:hypothetical protein
MINSKSLRKAMINNAGRKFNGSSVIIPERLLRFSELSNSPELNSPSRYSIDSPKKQTIADQ